ncbi:MAG: hypothetical protein PW734_07630 [Verrucomicrobium sp.]|nr:hypothetical protein [Verrucomicrobium sp.]
MRAFFTDDEQKQRGGTLTYVLLWLLGIPLPILLVVALLRGCK